MIKNKHDFIKDTVFEVIDSKGRSLSKNLNYEAAKIRLNKRGKVNEEKAFAILGYCPNGICVSVTNR